MSRGEPDVAIAYYERSLSAEPDLVQSHLSLAAAWLEKCDQSQACPHLETYVAARPENLMARSYFGELLLRQHRLPEARAQFARFDAEAQDQPEVATRQLIHCHSRLMEIAEAQEDEYAEHLHRGIGLYLLARVRGTLPDPEGELPTEGLLCSAAAELGQARQARPGEARPCWYLYEVWSRLGQRRPAVRWLREADAAAPFAFLTPAEQRALHLACQREDIGRDRR
jgi:tetratricopeptide (TPR) repeat protein